ncbi:MAG: REP-associated tyrosine transposase [Anaerolineae bacterium]
MASQALHTHLPHIDSPDLLQSITFRLADSMPAERRREWEALLSIRSMSARTEQIQQYLDRGYGKCILRTAAAAGEVERLLLDGDALRYSLLAWVIMPNHVHLLLRTIAPWTMQRIIQDIKKFSALKINKMNSSSGPVWQHSYFDRFIRDDGHLLRAAAYIHNNPVLAGVADDPLKWPFSSARRLEAIDDTFHAPWGDEW